jgi:opacity protein-like surface antigen
MRNELGIYYGMTDWDTWTEGGMSYDESNNSFNFITVMANSYWDIENETQFTPFLLGGVGFSRVEIDHQNNSYDDTVLAA